MEKLKQGSHSQFSENQPLRLPPPELHLEVRQSREEQLGHTMGQVALGATQEFWLSEGKWGPGGLGGTSSAPDFRKDDGVALRRGRQRMASGL